MWNQHVFAASRETTCGQYQKAAWLFVEDEASGVHQSLVVVVVPNGRRRKFHTGAPTRLQQCALRGKVLVVDLDQVSDLQSRLPRTGDIAVSSERIVSWMLWRKAH